MKITDLIKQLNELKELHGDVKVVIYNSWNGVYDSVLDTEPVHPTVDYNQDKTKPVWAVCVNTY